MGPKGFYRQNFSLFIVKFKKLGFIAPLICMNVYLFVKNVLVFREKYGRYRY